MNNYTEINPPQKPDLPETFPDTIRFPGFSYDPASHTTAHFDTVETVDGDNFDGNNLVDVDFVLEDGNVIAGNLESGAGGSSLTIEDMEIDLERR